MDFSISFAKVARSSVFSEAQADRAIAPAMQTMTFLIFELSIGVGWSEGKIVVLTLL